MGLRNLIRTNLVLVLACLGLSVSVHAASDRVFPAKGDPIVGSVLKDNLDVVEINIQGQTMNRQAVEVDRIEYALDATGWKDGTRSMLNGEFGNALSLFKMAAEELDSIKEPAKAQLYYNLGECAYNVGDYSGAEKSFSTVIDKYPASRYFPKSLDRLIGIYVRMKIANKIPPLQQKLSGLGGEYAVKATFYEGESLLSEGKPVEALAKYKNAESGTQNVETRALARLGQAKCLVQNGDFSKGREMAEAALGQGATYMVSATAYLIIGSAQLEEGTKLSGADQQNKLMEAVLSLQRVPMLYPKASEAEAEALYRTAECFRILIKNPIPNTPDARNRAKNQYNLVRARYPSSKWSDEAEKALNVIDR